MNLISLLLGMGVGAIAQQLVAGGLAARARAPREQVDRGLHRVDLPDTAVKRAFEQALRQTRARSR